MVLPPPQPQSLPSRPKLDIEALKRKLASNQPSIFNQAYPEPFGMATGGAYDLPFQLTDDPLLQQLSGHDQMEPAMAMNDSTQCRITPKVTTPIPPQILEGTPSCLQEIHGIQQVAQTSLVTATIQASEHLVNRDEILGGNYSYPEKRKRSSGPVEQGMDTNQHETTKELSLQPAVSNSSGIIRDSSFYTPLVLRLHETVETEQTPRDVDTSSIDPPLCLLKRKTRPQSVRIIENETSLIPTSTMMIFNKSTIEPEKLTVAPVVPNLEIAVGTLAERQLDAIASTPTIQSQSESEFGDEWAVEGRDLIDEVLADFILENEAEQPANSPINPLENEAMIARLSPLSTSSCLYPEEKYLLSQVDRRITVAETDELLKEVRRKIDNAEINDLMHTINLRISDVQKRELEPGGKICWIDFLSSYEKENVIKPVEDTLWDVAFYDENDEFDPPHSSPRKKRKTTLCLVEDQIFFEPTEFVAVKTLPKFIGKTDQLVFTTDTLLNAVVRKAKDCHTGSLCITLRNHENDYFSVKLEARGDEKLVKVSLRFIQMIIRSRQLRYLSSMAMINAEISSIDTNQLSDSDGLHQNNLLGANSNRTNAKFTDYLNFSQKVKDMKIKENEFNTIPLTFIKSSMWERHKSLIGSQCDDDCLCPLQLKSLTCNIVGEFIRKSVSKDPTWGNSNGLVEGQYPVGFIDHFIPKFVGLLQIEFPNENPITLYQRLDAMWTKHKGSVQFGITCKRNCHCSEGWEVVFNKGHFQKLPQSLPSKPAHICQGTSGPLSKPISTASFLTQHTPRKSSSLETSNEFQSNNQHKEFEIEFPSWQPLGLFAVNDTNRPVCKIFSVNGNERVDPRLAVGTILVSARISGIREEWSNISSCKDIEIIYERAKKGRQHISIRFINTEVKATVANAQSWSKGANKDWACHGAWQGKACDGWAGGAAIPSGLTGSITTTGTSVAPFAPPALSLARPFANTAALIVSPTNDECYQEPLTLHPSILLEQPTEKPLFAFLSTEVAVKHHGRTYSQKPILRTPKNSWTVQDDKERRPNSLHMFLPPSVPWKKGFKIRFRKNEKRFYSTDDCSFKMAIPLTKETDALIRTSLTTGHSIQKKDTVRPPSPEMLLETVNSSTKTCVDLFELLKDGANPTVSTTNKTPELHIKDKISSLQGEISRYEEGDSTRKSLNEQLIEANRKKKLLKIFTLAQDVMNQARFLKSHERLDIILASCEDLSLTDLGRDHETQNFVWWDVVVKGCKVPPTPSATISRDIDWSHVKSYHCNENLELAKARGEVSTIVLKLKKGNQDGDSIELGQTTIKIREIRHAGMSGGGIQSDLDISKYLNSCKISLKVKRKIAERDYRERKRQDAARKLRDVLQQIDNFVEETKDPRMESIAAEIRLSTPDAPPISLLHAAIYLDEPDFVEVLMNKYNANPHSKKSRETPLALAEKKFDKVIEDPELKKKRSKIHSLLLGKTAKEWEAEVDAVMQQASPEEDDDGDDPVEVFPTGQDNFSDKTRISSVAFLNPQDFAHCTADWMHPQTRGPCIFFEGYRCKRGRDCLYSHVMPSLGPSLNSQIDESSSITLNNTEGVLKFNDATSKGLKYFTAGFIDLHNIRHYAEGGNYEIEVAGVFWYKSQETAATALTNVVRANFFQQKHPRFFRELSEPLSLQSLNRSRHFEQPAATADFSSYASNESLRDSSEGEYSLFSKLTIANLSNYYMMLYKKPLRREDWNVKIRNGKYSAEFEAEVDGHFRQYASSCHPTGESHEGRWWYNSEKEAKASAFDNFLDHAAAFGMVTRDKLW